jgi:hypothetical protein
MGASKVGPCLEDCTINTYGFNLRQGQGDDTDPTRRSVYYDGVTDYLQHCGIESL